MTTQLNQTQRRGVQQVFANAAIQSEKPLEGLMTAFNAFKETQDERIKGIEGKFDDVLTKEKENRIDDEMSKLQAELDAMNAKIEAANLNGGIVEAEDTKAKQAFSAYLRGVEPQAGMLQKNGPDGGYFTPNEWDRTITGKLVELSPFRNISTVKAVSGNEFTKLYNMGGLNSGWAAEDDPRNETNTNKYKQLSFKLGELYAAPRVSQRIFEDSEVDLDAEILGSIEQEFAVQEGLAFMSGDGVEKPLGLLTYAEGAANEKKHPFGAIESVKTNSAGVLSADDIIDLTYSLKSIYHNSARFVMSQTTMSKIRKIKDNDGLYIWQRSLEQGQPSSLNGFAITQVQDMPSVATGAVAIAFGDFKRGYEIYDRRGMSVLRDPFSSKPHIIFYTTKRMGGGVVDPQCIKFLKVS